jgi:hypothetical protein
MFSIVAIWAKFSAISQVRAMMVPTKIYFIKLWKLVKKKDGNYGQFVQLMCDHWHITDFTAQFANELEEAKS